MSNDIIFAKDFIKMMKELKAISGYQELSNIPIPDELQREFIGTAKYEKVMISGINDQYYGKLNNSEALLLKGYKLGKRKFDADGKFMTDKEGRTIFVDVPCPQNSYGIASDININVPYKYKCEKGETFQFVDYQEKDGRRKYIYILPKKYMYKINQTALVFSWRKINKCYSGVALSCKNGHMLYIHIIPYKVGRKPADYRIVTCKTNCDYSMELEILKNYWIKTNFIFNPDECMLDEPFKDRDNMAYMRVDGSMDVYYAYDMDKSLDGDTEMDLLSEGDDNYSLT